MGSNPNVVQILLCPILPKMMCSSYFDAASFYEEDGAYHSPTCDIASGFERLASRAKDMFHLSL